MKAADGSMVDFEVYDREVEFLASSDIDGLFPSATTGEFVHLWPQEHMEILRRTAKVARGSKQMAAGACSSNIDILTAGCCGSMTAFSTILPEINAEIYRRFRSGDIKGAQELNSSYLGLIRLADSIAFQAGYKLIMEWAGN